MSRRISCGLAVAGLIVSTYLLLVQLDVIEQPWDPLFGSHSTLAVLKSSFSRSLPIPDSTLGVAGYAAELALLAIGVAASSRRWRQDAELVYRALATAMAGGSITLLAVQAFTVGRWCGLCLLSAAISIAIAALSWSDAARTSVRGGRECPASAPRR